jgi:hypothetical protein
MPKVVRQPRGEEVDVREEYFENQATGVEAEEESAPSPVEPEPWDPDKIRIHTKHYSLKQTVDSIAEREIDLAPDFQRGFVWKDWQRWGLIESLLLGIPLPSFYFSEDGDGRVQVVDGVQRLTTIYQFVNLNAFALERVTYLHELEGKRFKDLNAIFRRRLQNAQFVVHVIDPQTPYRVKFDIFRRINTGGSPLSAQEIRHCMSLERSRQFLKALANDDSFVRATGGSLRNHPRMADREVALRFCAFRILTVEDYTAYARLDEFLGKVTDYIDRKLSDIDLEHLKQEFIRAMNNAYEVFGDHAFRKWPLDSERRNPINRALVETWGTVLADYDERVVTERRARLIARAREIMTSDPSFIASIAGSTGDPASVRTRFDRVQAVANEVLA